MRASFKGEGCCRWLRGFEAYGWALLVMFSTNVMTSADHPPQSEPQTLKTDERPAKLQAFFGAYHCPGPLHVEEYLQAADTYGIDYRLLPALSVRESTCGRFARKNNRWGWDSAKTGFESVGHGIRYVSRELACGMRYRDKSLDEKLRTYNPNPKYPEEIKRLMQQIQSE